ncbi:hypothetical protein [Halorarius litoreus]|uniref:hypothetical protein n=1 Tax=Halorarius litoreus TaxID=2962676 RepID=UPI0020CEE754|nr:hypothetical protein [Halorarius litoreus]
MSQECHQHYRNKFHVYDQAVDVISCWESLLRYSYAELFDEFYFERFPSIPRDDDDKDDLTPDFTAYFNEDYGIIGEVKRTFPNDDVAFNSTISQIAGYDATLPLKTASGGRDVPETCDILLVISGSSAPQIGTRLRKKLVEENLFRFDANLVLVRYQYNTDATLSRYEFQRVTQLEDEFRDEPLPDDISLSNNLGEEGDYDTVPVFPKHFAPLKVQKPLCNDQPPEPYLATILWHKVFPEYLSLDEYRQWRNGTAQKTMEFTDSPQGICDHLNDYMKEGTARRRWVRDTLQFLEEANLADFESGDYTIGFRDLVREVGEGNMQEGTQMLQRTKELAYMFIDRYCEYSDSFGGSDEEEIDSQSSLEEYF